MLTNIGNLLIVFSVILLYVVLSSNSFSNIIFVPLININNISTNLEFILLIDNISLSFLLVLGLITGSVVSFGSNYLENDINLSYFIVVLMSFVFSMFILIITPHFFWVLLGWDGLGVTSFLLICYYSASSSYSASLKTYLINRLGDGFFLGSLGFIIFNNLWFNDQTNYVFLIVLLLALYTKSAHYPFGSWLPEAMAAPTPVSALVHSSTLVTAGLYIIIRHFHNLNNVFLLFIGVLGLWTLFIASLSACLNNDSKKIIAFSTMSQLGLMSFSIFVGSNLLAYGHLLSHAVIKALLFITAGFLLLVNNHGQDARLFNINFNTNPVLSKLVLITGLSLSGFIYTAGFFSKENILEYFTNNYNIFIYFLLIASLVLTVAYTLKLFKSFVSDTNLLNNNNNFNEAINNNYINISFVGLILAILVGGWISNNNSFFILESSSLNKVLVLCVVYSSMIVILILSILNIKISFLFNLGFMVYLNSSFLVNKVSYLSFNYIVLDSGWFSWVLNSLYINDLNNNLPFSVFNTNYTNSLLILLLIVVLILV